MSKVDEQKAKDEHSTKRLEREDGEWLSPWLALSVDEALDMMCPPERSADAASES